MSSDQKAARIFGGLFLLTFVTSIAGALLYTPLLDHKDYIVNGTADVRIQLGALFEVGLVVTNIGTAVVLYPVARRYSETLALSWVASRIVESTLIAVGAIALLSAVTLHQDAGAGDASALLVQGRALVALHDRTFLFGPGFCVGIGNGIILGCLMWKSGLVPRRLALLGLIAGPLIILRATLILFGVVAPGDPTDLLGVPEFTWEAGLGFYPLIKGFRIPPAPPARAGSSRGETGRRRPPSTADRGRWRARASLGGTVEGSAQVLRWDADVVPRGQSRLLLCAGSRATEPRGTAAIRNKLHAETA